MKKTLLNKIQYKKLFEQEKQDGIEYKSLTNFIKQYEFCVNIFHFYEAGVDDTNISNKLKLI